MLSDVRNYYGLVGLDNALEAIGKLEQLRELNLPQDLFRHVAPPLLAGLPDYSNRNGVLSR
jgi:hypothetical protein